MGVGLDKLEKRNGTHTASASAFPDVSVKDLTRIFMIMV